MRFLFINQYYAPDYAATAQQLSDLCEKLASLGHEVHVLTSKAIYDGRPLDLPAEEVLNGVHVHRIGISSTGRERIRERLYGYASFYWQAFLRVHFLPRPDVIITLTTPPLISILGAWTRMLRRARYVYWVMDVYPDIAVKAGVLRRFGPVSSLWGLMGRASYLAANRIVVLGDDMAKAIARKGRLRHKITVINSWSGAEEVTPVPIESNSFRREMLGAPAFSLMYSGNMGTCHTFEAVIEGILALKDRSELNFAFVGGGKQTPKLKAALQSPCGNVRFLPYQDRADLGVSLSAPDAHLITLNPLYDGLLVPSKVYGVMAAERAILFVGSKDNEIAQIIERANCGIVVDPSNGTAFREAVEWMATHKEEVKAMGQRGRAYFLDHYEKEVLTTKFAALLEEEGLQPGVRGVRALCHKTLAFASKGRRSGDGLQQPAKEAVSESR